MAQIDINKYAFTPAAVFDLQGRCWYSDRSKGVPCRIKVGPRRWLTEHVIPEELGVTIWQETERQTTYLRNEPVQTFVDENGILCVDMAAFAKEYFGKEHVHFCESEDWKWYKNQAYSDTFLTTDCGIAAHRSTWLDISVNHSDLYLMPGTLNLCGHDVRHIYWETFCDALGAPGEAMRPVVEEILSGAHAVDAKKVIRRLKQVEPLQDWGFNHLAIRTDRGEFRIGVSLDRYLSIDLKEEGHVASGYEPNRKNRVLENIDILLSLMQASNGDEICSKVEELCLKGLLTERKRK